jgi:precorrin-6A/cobalt-precorrin-6A reductase
MAEAGRILILGGTRQAVDLAERLVAAGHEVITSLAGVIANPVRPSGQLRVGGFGGAAGLRRYVAEAKIAAVIDATHPFAVQMARHAAELAVPVLRLERPAWAAEPNWTEVESVAEAASALPSGARPLVTIGRKEVDLFFARRDLSGVARMIEPREGPPGWLVILQRPPFSLDDERRLMEDQAITHLVSKNAGGDDTHAKIVAAREKKLPVIMVKRPTKPPVPAFESPDDLTRALAKAISP